MRAGQDKIVSFDVVLLFSRVSIREAMNNLSTFYEGYPEAALPCPSLLILQLQWPILRTDTVAVGSPLFPVITNFFTQGFEEVALN
jgi:hypothetical protein